MSKRGLAAPKTTPRTSFCHIASSKRLMLHSVCACGATPVTTQVPPLPVSAMAPAIRSPYITLGTRITASAIWPRVRSVTSGERLLHRSGGVGGAEVEGRLLLELDGIDGDDVRAPPMRAPWTALMPTPPTPTTTTVSPGFTSAR